MALVPRAIFWNSVSEFWSWRCAWYNVCKAMGSTFTPFLTYMGWCINHYFYPSIWVVHDIALAPVAVYIPNLVGDMSVLAPESRRQREVYFQHVPTFISLLGLLHVEHRKRMIPRITRTRGVLHLGCSPFSSNSLGTILKNAVQLWPFVSYNWF